MPKNARSLLIALVAFVLSPLLLAGCQVPPGPNYALEAPVVGERAGINKSSVAVGVLFSSGARASLQNLQHEQQRLTSWIFANPAAMQDLDPSTLTKGLDQLLQSRFSKVVTLNSINDATALGLGLCLDLDLSVTLGHISGAATSVTITGRFLRPDGSMISTASGSGAATVPFPAFTIMFKEASNSALQQFGRGMDTDAQLAAFLKSGTLASPTASSAPGAAKDDASVAAMKSRLEEEKTRLAQEVEGLRKQQELASVQAEKSRLEAEKAALTEQRRQQETLVKPVKSDAAYSKRVALVIGNGRYKDAPLVNPPNDAKDISEKLKAQGFSVTVRIDADRRAMEDAIRDFTQNANNAVGLFYFAGHGVQVEGENYLLPIGGKIDSEGDVRYEAVPVGKVLDNLKYSGASMHIVILDACRNNPFKRSFRGASRGLALMVAPRGSIISYSTAPGETAQDGEGRNSPFAKAMLDNLGKDMPIEFFFKQVGVAVAQETNGKQRPWISSDFLGVFSFGR
jgi:hypothetical protein